jgi:WD repeat-containing protein 70
MPDAHSPNCEVTDIVFFDKNFATRSMDDSMKLWDLRNTSKPIFEWHDLVNLSSKTNITISPKNNIIVTGTSVRKNYGQGTLRGFSTTTGESVCEVPMGQASVITSLWHAALNQIFIGMGDGKIQVLYSPTLSRGGVLKCISKQEKRKTVEESSIHNNSVFK